MLGNVKKITANSRYEIMTPHGVAGVRGTDFHVMAVPTDDHKWVVTFESITGTITVSAVINGITVTHTLTDGTSWVIGENPTKMTQELIQSYQNQILNLVTFVENTFNAPPPTGRPGAPTPGTTTPQTINPVQPFPGGPPQGPQSSP